MKQLCKVVMLPTEKAENCLYINNSNNKFNYHKGYLTQDYLTNSLNSKSYHLYLTSDEEIKEGDWYYNSEDNNIFKSDRDFKYSGIKCFKIIATTDKSIYNSGTKNGYSNKESSGVIYSPEIPASFIKAYVESKEEIREVLVEYEEFDRNVLGVYRPKLRSNNTVIISASKTYTREEVIELMFASYTRANSNLDLTQLDLRIEFDKWINKKL